MGFLLLLLHLVSSHGHLKKRELYAVVVPLEERVVPPHFKKLIKEESCAEKTILGDMGGCTS